MKKRTMNPNKRRFFLAIILRSLKPARGEHSIAQRLFQFGLSGICRRRLTKAEEQIIVAAQFRKWRHGHGPGDPQNRSSGGYRSSRPG
ncbi:MAG: hypothetical protein PHX05_09885, partial [Acidobacteriota bacterium]|nr:hypothetical protein [Acidobacteriota bacterium]